MSASHPIRVEPHGGRVIVRLGAHTVADTTRALCLREASYPPVAYVPRADVDMSALTASEHATTCPFKGDASYFDIDVGGQRARNAAWSYETPHANVAEIGSYLAFYPASVDIVEVLD